MDVEELEEKLDQTYEMGVSEVYRQASNKILDMSIDLFKKDKNDQAKKMKELSKMLLKISEKNKNVEEVALSGDSLNITIGSEI